MRRGTKRLIAQAVLGVGLACVAPSSRAAAPVTPFLRVDRAVVPQGDEVRVRLEAATGGPSRALPFPAAGIEWMLVRSGGRQQNLHDVRPTGTLGGAEVVAVRVSEPGATMIGADFTPVIIETTAGELAAFARSVGVAVAADALSALPANRALRVRHVVSLKALVRAADEGFRPSAIATSKTGQAVEIRVHADPTAQWAGTDIALTDYVEGDKRPRLPVRATSLASGRVHAFETDGGASGRFRLTSDGPWTVEVHDVVALLDDAAADWGVVTATLTFEAPRPPQAEP